MLDRLFICVFQGVALLDSFDFQILRVEADLSDSGDSSLFLKTEHKHIWVRLRLLEGLDDHTGRVNLDELSVLDFLRLLEDACILEGVKSVALLEDFGLGQRRVMGQHRVDE